MEHGTLGGPLFNPTRMTWIKPSFAWMLYRCGYSAKHSQERVLKLKLPHSEMASLLQECACTHGGGRFEVAPVANSRQHQPSTVRP